MNRKSYAAGLIIAAAVAAPALANNPITASYGPGAGGAVPDNLSGVFTSVINVPVVGNNMIISLNSVTMTWGPAHTWAGDIEVQLTAPNGDNVHLHSRVLGTGSTSFGDSSDLLGPYVFVAASDVGGDFSAAAAAAAAGAPIAAGTYRRSTTALGFSGPPADNDDYNVFAGDAAAGNWTLTIRDYAGGDTGSLASWSLNLTIGKVPAPGALALLGVAGLARRRRRN